MLTADDVAPTADTTDITAVAVVRAINVGPCR